jgi:hypothetical protein
MVSFSRFPETYTDAYDKLYDRLVVHKGLLRWIPGIGSWIEVILNQQLRMDRYVPQSPDVPSSYTLLSPNNPATPERESHEQR